MAITNNISTDLADLLATHNFDAEMSNSRNNSANAEDATIFKFDFVTQTGRNYGTAVIVISDDNELMLFYGDNLGRGMEPEDKDQWFAFMKELKDFSIRHNFYNFSPKNLNSLKRTMQGMAAIKEGLFEGYYGNRRVSYMGEQTQARLVINHNRTLGEDDKRYRYVESLFIETADQERFRLPFKSLAGGRAMLEHVRQGGRPYDVRGNHITEIVSEMAVLSRFNRAQHSRVFEGVTQELVENAQQYYYNLQETVKQLGGSRGYQAYFETWAPDHVGEAEALVENLRDLFVEQTLDARIEAALPTLAKIQQQGNKMKEAQIFESWINQLSEGTWALPETPEQQEKLNKLMSGELIVGPDATNATELLYDVVGDDELFDILNDLADRSQGRANIWDDSDVQRRLAELGIQTPQSTEAEPANVAQDTAPAVKEDQLDEIGDTPAGKDALRAVQNRAYDTMDAWSKNSASGFSATPKQVKKATGAATAAGNRLHGFGPDRMKQDTVMARDALRKQLSVAEGGAKDRQWSNKDMERLRRAETELDDIFGTPDDSWTKTKQSQIKKRIQTKPIAGPKGVLPEQGVAEGDNMSTFVEDRELSTMLKYAGVPIREGVLNDDTRNTWDHLLDRFRHEVEQFKQGSDLDSDLYDALFDYYSQHGAMPYGVAKGRTGDPHSWISDRLADDLGIKENLISPMIMPVSEGSCNMTMEGEYCPEHGLMECGSMEEDGGAVGMPYSMGEEMDEAMFPGSAIGDKLRAAKDSIGRGAGEALKGAMIAAPGAGAGASAGAAMSAGASSALFAPALGAGALGGAAAALGGFLTYKGLNWLAQKLFGTKEEALQFANAHLEAASSGQPQFEFQGKTYPVKIKSPQEAQQLIYKIRNLQSQLGEDHVLDKPKHDDAINSNSAMTGSYYEGKETDIQEGDALLARIKSLALLR